MAIGMAGCIVIWLSADQEMTEVDEMSYRYDSDVGVVTAGRREAVLTNSVAVS